MNFFRLIRFPNLLIVTLTQYSIYYLVFLKNYQAYEIAASLNFFQFFLLVLSTLCIAAGGYVINDILDYEIDVVNKPDKMIVGRSITVKKAKQYYWWSILIGFALSLYLALRTQNLPLLSLYPTAVFLLYAYSKYFKKSFLIGNLIVSFFCAFVAGIVWVAERNSFSALQKDAKSIADYLEMILVFYLLFAFISTLFREIIKDIEDMEGDRSANCRTLPIVVGEKGAKVVSAAAAILLLILLGYLLQQLSLYKNMIIITFAILLIIIPLLYALFRLYSAKFKKDFHHISQMAKFIMLAGLILLFLIA
ncbi:MAG: geranylgeranylglycerol-phosphate geranylgeranyltransferase [Bacteroidota bacterium]